MSVAIFTQVTTPATSYDLTDLPTTKDELGIKTSDTSNDAFLSRAITQSSAAISNFCNRVFQVEALIDTFELQRSSVSSQRRGGERWLTLSRFPAVTITSVVENGVTLVEDTDFKADKRIGILYRLSTDTGAIVPWPTLPVVVTYVGGYTKYASAASTVPANPGPYTITVANAAAFALDKGVSYSNGTALVAVTALPGPGQYSVAAGVYTFNAADASANVVIAYLYAAIPDDLIAATLRLVTMRFKAKGRDPMLMQHSEPQIGEDRWWVGASSQSNFTPEIDNLLSSFRVPVTS